MRKLTVLLAASFVALLALSACGEAGNPTPTPPPTGTPTSTTGSGDTIEGKAPVETVEIRILESMPVQVQVVATGYLPDACTKMGEITQSRDGNTFNITIATTRPAEAACAEVINPFVETIPLDVAGLAAGTYTVNVNGVTGTFELTADNVAP